MVGLKRGTVKLVPYRRQWVNSFKQEKKKLFARLGNLIIDIQHVGSTAIPGIYAKPIIDMSLGIKNFKDAKKLIKPLDTIGYHFYKKFGRQILFAKGPDKKRTHYLHVMKYNGAKWKGDLLFRDFLIRRPAQAKDYTRLKQRLAKQYPNDRERYTAGKKYFIGKIKKSAKL